MTAHPSSSTASAEDPTARLLAPMLEALASERLRIDEALAGADIMLHPAERLLRPGPFHPRLAITHRRRQCRRRLRRQLRTITALLDRLREETRAAPRDAEPCDPESLAFERRLRRYDLALQRLQRTLGANRPLRARGSAVHQATCLFESVERRLAGIADVAVALVDRFDEAAYLQANPDVAEACRGKIVLSGLEHLAVAGLREALEGARTIPGIERTWLRTQLGKSGICCPRKTDPVIESSAAAGQNLPSVYHYYANPGPDFEVARIDIGKPVEPRVRAVAFYRCGEGVSERRRLARTLPRFLGHYQPRIPRDLGFHDPDDEHVIERQCALARHNGIEAFCFHYHGFDGKRYADKPLEQFMRLDVPQEFCILWASGNRRNTSDDLDHESAFLCDTARLMRHARYLRVGGRPLFMIFRPALLPSARQTLARWREHWQGMLGVEPLIFMVQGFEDLDPRVHGLDGAVEFPPHKLCDDIPDINESVSRLAPDFEGHVRPYVDMVRRSLDEAAPDHPLIKTVSPHWDNDAQRDGRGLCLHGSTPDRYGRWLSEVADFAEAQPVYGESLVFIRAWNDWAESAYLEPDVHYGHAYLNATRAALQTRLTIAEPDRALLLVPDSSLDDNRDVLTRFVRVCRRRFGMRLTVLSNASCARLDGLESYADVFVREHLDEPALADWALQRGVHDMICVAPASSELVLVARQSGVRPVVLSREATVLDKASNDDRDWAFDVLATLHPGLRKLSVVLPNYNYARYLDERLTSVFTQRYPVYEIVVLDDHSTDDSLRVIESAVERAGRDIELLAATTNSGNVFRQWRKGLARCRGDYVWIAEADDRSLPNFLPACLAAMGPSTVLSFSDSMQIDTLGETLAESYDYYFRTVDESLFETSFQREGTAFARQALSVRNVMLNVSAVVWHRQSLAGAMQSVGTELESWSLVGDWRLYLEVLSRSGVDMAFVAAPLNVHRRHEDSVTHSLDHQRHLDEIQSMHRIAAEKLGSCPTRQRQLDAYVSELRDQFGLTKDSLDRAA